MGRVGRCLNNFGRAAQRISCSPHISPHNAASFSPKTVSRWSPLAAGQLLLWGKIWIVCFGHGHGFHFFEKELNKRCVEQRLQHRACTAGSQWTLNSCTATYKQTDGLADYGTKRTPRHSIACTVASGKARARALTHTHASAAHRDAWHQAAAPGRMAPGRMAPAPAPAHTHAHTRTQRKPTCFATDESVTWGSAVISTIGSMRPDGWLPDHGHGRTRTGTGTKGGESVSEPVLRVALPSWHVCYARTMPSLPRETLVCI